MKKIVTKVLLFQSMLSDRGALFEMVFSPPGSMQGYVETPEYKFRYSLDEVEICPKLSFDRWANSSRFVCRPVPSSVEDLEAMYYAMEQVKTKSTPVLDEGAVDLWPLVRKYRRQARNTARLAVKRYLSAQ